MNERLTTRETSVIFANPPSSSREGQQRRGMFPLPLIALANSLQEKIHVEHTSPDLLVDYSLANRIIAESNAKWLAMTCYQETMRSVLELATIAKNSWEKFQKPIL